MTASPGFYLPLSLPRRLIADLMHASLSVPTNAVERRLHLAPLVGVRAAAASPRPGWTALFTKAWALVCARRPALRRSFIRWPWQRLYQHSTSVASIAVERPYGGEEAVFFLHVTRPEERSVADLDRRLKDFRQRDPGECGSVRRQLRFARVPGPLRRLLWSVGLSMGRCREHFFGTFAVTNSGNPGVRFLHPRTVLTTTLTFGQVAVDGAVDVRLIYDPRVLDSGTVARAFADLEGVLLAEVVTELGYMRGVSYEAGGAAA